jgi:hypothetical protein
MYHAQVNLYFLVLLLVFRAQRTKTNAKKKKTKISTQTYFRDIKRFTLYVI